MRTLLTPCLETAFATVRPWSTSVAGRSADDIFGYPDNLKFHSSVTLFAWVVAHGPPLQMLGNHVFADALTKYFKGIPDQATLDRLPPHTAAS